MRTLVVNALRLCGRRTAIGRHLEYLATHWSNQVVPFDRILFLTPRPVVPPRLGTTSPIEFRTMGSALPPLAWEQLALPAAARRAAVLFSEYTCPLLRRGATVVANHGIYEAVPEAFSRWEHFRARAVNSRSARHADRVIANSASTKADLVRFYGVPAERIDVVYPGPADFFFASHDADALDAAVTGALGAPGPFAIFVGKLATRRHVPNLIEAFAAVRRRHALPHRLLIVGPNVNALPIHELAAVHGVGEAVVYHEHMEQDTLARLYAAADLYVLPSTYEGISWTMFEAMASGTAVLTVEHPALEEGASGAVLALPDPSVASIADGLSRLLTDAPARAALARLGRERARDFSLSKSASDTLAILDRAAPPSDPA